MSDDAIWGFLILGSDTTNSWCCKLWVWSLRDVGINRQSQSNRSTSRFVLCEVGDPVWNLTRSASGHLSLCCLVLMVSICLSWAARLPASEGYFCRLEAEQWWLGLTTQWKADCWLTSQPAAGSPVTCLYGCFKHLNVLRRVYVLLMSDLNHMLQLSENNSKGQHMCVSDCFLFNPTHWWCFGAHYQWCVAFSSSFCA